MMMGLVGGRAPIVAWTPASFASVVEWWNPFDNSKVYMDNGVTLATPGTHDVYEFRGSIAAIPVQQTSAGNRPAYASDKSVDFTAANVDRLVSTNSALLAAANGTDNGWTLIAAVKRGPIGVSVTPFSWAVVGSTANYNRLFFGSGNTIGMQRSAAAEAVLTSQTAAAVGSDIWYVVTWVYTGTALTVRLNGVDQSAAGAIDSATVLSTTHFNFGVTHTGTGPTYATPFDGAIGGVILSDNTNAAHADIPLAETYLGAQVGVTI